jgi:hypothetical protein
MLRDYYANVFFISGLEQKKVETSVSRLEMKRDWAQSPLFVLKIAFKASHVVHAPQNI